MKLAQGLTRQALPNDDYVALVGIALIVFNSNNNFLIENLLYITNKENWWDLLDLEGGALTNKIKSTEFRDRVPDEVVELYASLVHRRNRLVHSFQITDKDGSQKLDSKYLASDKIRANQQIIITEEFLKTFIRDNQKLSDLLYDLRDKVRGRNGR